MDKQAKQPFLNKYRLALTIKPIPIYKQEEQSKLNMWFQKNSKIIGLILSTSSIVYTIFCFLYDFRLFFILIAIGGIIYYQTYFLFFIWWLKVFVFKRNFYQHRRELYIQGTLLHHFNHKQPKAFNLQKATIIIWAETTANQLNRYKIVSKKNSKEYIKL